MDAIPSKLDVIRNFAYNYCCLKQDKRKSAVNTAKKTRDIWMNLGRLPQDAYRAADRIIKLHDDYLKLKKQRKVESEKANRKREDFLRHGREVFDISNDASRINISKRIQANNKRSESAPINHPAASGNQRAQHQIAGSSNEHVPVIYDNISDNAQNQDTRVRRAARFDFNVEMDVDNNDGESTFERKIKISDELCSVFDRAHLSNQLASLVFMTAAKCMGVDVENVICSASTVARCRDRNRKDKAELVKTELNRENNLTLHYDGKTFINRYHKEKRLAVVISDGKESKILGIPQVNKGNSECHANIIFDIVESWEVSAQIRSLCFDTERVNTGRLTGVCVRLEQKLKRKLLFTPCRRHVLEIVLAAVCANTVELNKSSKAPTIELFEKFAKRYAETNFERSRYSGCIEDRFFAVFFNCNERQNIITFCQNLLTRFKNTRSDYIELLKLTVIFFSGNGCEHTVYVPGPYNRARFMSRIIYSLKIYLYRGQLNLKNIELDNVRRLLLFVFKVYFKNWFTNNISVIAPRMDLQMLRDIEGMRESLPNTASVAYNKFKNHLWYLSDIMIALSFFDKDVPTQVKEKMVINLRRDSTQRNDSRYVINPETNPNDLCLSDFVTKITYKFFEILDIDHSFLQLPPDEWQQNEHFLLGQKRAQNLVVVNDAAERTINLHKTHNTLARSDLSKEQVVQVVERNRKDFKILTKANIINQLTQEI